MSRVLLSKIRSITLYKDELTKARRLPAIPQLTCIGSPCRLFQPDVVRCYNNGGEGVDVDWTCEADLPEKLRFGRTDVSCEGWDYAGDSYVLKGSCGLEYRLVNTDSSYKLPLSAAEKLINYFFILLSASIFLFILSQIFKQCCTRRSGPLDSNTNNNPNPRRSPNYYTYPSSPSQPPDDNDAPPPPYTPYSRSGSVPPKKGDNSSNNDINNNNRNNSNGNNSVPPNNNNASGSGPGGLGFWSGVGLGSLGGLAAGRQFFGGNRGGNNNNNSNGGGVGGGGGYRPGWGPEYDWERQRLRGGGSSRVHFPSGSRNGRSGSGSSGGSGNGNGSGSLGSMRRSTGYGTTNVR